MKSHRTTQCVQNQNANRFQYSLDVLTDGSEYTGYGTIFLTVSRSSKYSNNVIVDDNNLNSADDERTIIARYALTGISSVTGRLASDQTFKLSPLRAMFSPSRSDVLATAGIPSILLALSNHSLTGELTVVGPDGMDTYMDEMTNLILGKRRKYPCVSTCVVPRTDGSAAAVWWKVFEDEFILVHARSIVMDGQGSEYPPTSEGGDSSASSSCSSDDESSVSSSSSSCSSSSSSSSSSSQKVDTNTPNCDSACTNSNDCSLSIIYIVTLRNQNSSTTRFHNNNNNNNNNTYSFVVLPSGVDSTTCGNILHPLPDDVTSVHDEPLKFMLHVNPKKECIVAGSAATTSHSGSSSGGSPDLSGSRHINNEVGHTASTPDGSLHNVTNGDDDDVKLTSSIRSQKFLRIHPKLRKISNHHLATIPNDNGGEWDDGLLIRASVHSKLLHRAMPYAFPVHRGGQMRNSKSLLPRGQQPHSIHCSSESSVPLNNIPPKNNIALENSSIVAVTKLSSCTSILLLNIHSNKETICDNGFSTTPRFQIIDRKQEIQSKAERKGCSGTQSISTDDDEIDTEIQENLVRLERFYSGTAHAVDADGKETESTEVGAMDSANHDTNEIDLSDESSCACSDDSTQSAPSKRIKRDTVADVSAESMGLDEVTSEIDVTKPHFLTLGTGCASPSPLRGSSGYAILLPTMSIEPQCNSTPLSTTGRPQKWRQHLTLSALMECGEGTLTSLSRYLRLHSNGTNLAQVRLIWISHAHLDHYGELPVIIKEINNARPKTEVCTCLDARASKRPTHTKRTTSPTCEGRQNSIPRCTWCQCISPPIVIAPQKVLHFLDLSLDCNNGYQRKSAAIEQGTEDQNMNETRLYVGISNRDFDGLPWAQQVRDSVSGFELILQESDCIEGLIRRYRPFSLVRSIPVEHCPNAYALLLRLNIGVEITNTNTQIINPSLLSFKQFPFKVPSNAGTFFHLCYSGDTRPSANLVRACRTIISSGGHISLLVHEATFDDDEKGKHEAIYKRHSTVREALGIAQQIQCKACILTHFSQRYPKLPPGHSVYRNPNLQNGNGSSSTLHLSSANMELFVTASDGMIIPMTNSFASAIPLLSQCLINVLEKCTDVTSIIK